MTRAWHSPRKALDVLARHGVRFVVIGGVAANALGSPTATFDLDICYARDGDNLERLAAALKELKAHARGAPLAIPFLLDAKTLKTEASLTFDTDAGALDCLGTPAGTGGYEQLQANALDLEIAGHTVSVASLEDIIRMKRAAGSPKDRLALETLGALQEEIDALEAAKARPRKKPPKRR